MRKIIHLSDLHFGTEIPERVAILLDDIHQMKPDVIVVSGDLTQRALTLQFSAAQKFLYELKQYPVISVPGNHDIALYNMMERFFYPYYKYNRWIKSEFGMEYSDDYFAILGINSVTPFKVMGGFVTEQQLNLVKTYFQSHQQKIKIIVMHHNLIHSVRHKIINDADKIIDVFASCAVDLVLCGHIHSAHLEQIKRNELKHNLHVITAGTAISTRTIEPNSYNLITFSNEHSKCITRGFQNGHFESIDEKSIQFDPIDTEQLSV